jgi:hypothetical protein
MALAAEGNYEAMCSAASIRGCRSDGTDTLRGVG